MKKRVPSLFRRPAGGRRRLPFFSFFFLVLAGCSVGHPAVPRTEAPFRNVEKQIHLKEGLPLTAGVAKVEITPPVGTPLAGYSKRHGKPSVGIRDPLYVRALVLGDGEDLVVLVSTDILLFPPTLAEKILKDISQKLHIPRQAIILAGTHTHSGTGAIAPGFLYEISFGHYRKEIEEGLASRVLWAVQQALEHRQPARWAFGERNLDGLTENRMIPSGAIDPALQGLFLESMEGRVRAIVVDMAAHATLMDSDDFRLSADFPGEAARTLEATYPGSVCLFFNGAAGDLKPRESALGANSDERINRFGKAVAEVTTELINRMIVSSHSEIAAWGGSVALPTPQIHLGRILVPAVIGRMMRPSEIYLNVISLDRIILVPLSAEMTTDLGRRLKAELLQEGFQTILIGYANGYLGYAVTPEQYKNKTYESWMTWYGADFGDLMIERIHQLIRFYPQKKRDQKPPPL